MVSSVINYMPYPAPKPFSCCFPWGWQIRVIHFEIAFSLIWMAKKWNETLPFPAESQLLMISDSEMCRLVSKCTIVPIEAIDLFCRRLCDFDCGCCHHKGITESCWYIQTRDALALPVFLDSGCIFHWVTGFSLWQNVTV